MTEAKETHAVYAGSFDPPTLGHEWVIAEALKLFSHLTVAVARNTAKKYTFGYEERVSMLRAMMGAGLASFDINVIENDFLVDWARQRQRVVTHLVRGMRNVDDFEYERAMRNVNEDRNPSIGSVFLVPPRRLCEISSSFVKGLVGFAGWESLAGKYVSPRVLKSLKVWHGTR